MRTSATLRCARGLARSSTSSSREATQPFASRRLVSSSLVADSIGSGRTQAAARLPLKVVQIQNRTFGSSAIAFSLPQDSNDAWKLAKVPHRGVLEVSGRDTVKLLQGLVSNDVKALTSTTSASSDQQSPVVVYAGFMNPQGRMLADAFIHRQAPLEDGSPRWLLDIDSRTLPSLLSFVKKFKLRSKVTLTDVSTSYSVVQAWTSSTTGSPPSAVADRLSLDPRCPTMGYRGVLSKDDHALLRDQVTPAEEEEYTVHRILQGIAEGALDVPEGSSLPLENNLDYMHGVDFRKGCYVGQELTARTHHTGVVRKRIVPVLFYPSGTSPPTSTIEVDRTATFELPNHLAEIRSKPVSASSGTQKPARGKAAGKFTSGIYNIGLACLRLEQVQRWSDPSQPGSEDGLEMSALSSDGQSTLLVKPFIPSWWPQQPQPTEENDAQA